MEPSALKENFQTQLDTVEKEITQLTTALAQRRELALKLQGAIEAMQLQIAPTEETKNAEVSEEEETEDLL